MCYIPSKNKTPAEDGFSKEFYETFFDHLKQNLLDSYNEAFQKGSLSVSQRRGVISFKNDCDLSELTGWRPITFFYLLLCINDVNMLSIKKIVEHRRHISLGSFSIDDGNGSENVSFKINSRFFNLRRVYSNLLKMATVGEFPWS